MFLKNVEKATVWQKGGYNRIYFHIDGINKKDAPYIEWNINTQIWTLSYNCKKHISNIDLVHQYTWKDLLTKLGLDKNPNKIDLRAEIDNVINLLQRAKYSI
ncbi:MAG: hypothetical protein LBD17_04080 [Endomicrobium sp.]|jgi:hypothetical protein|nr:hypothetical protein [Endomicrobium sp.]